MDSEDRYLGNFWQDFRVDLQMSGQVLLGHRDHWELALVCWQANLVLTALYFCPNFFMFVSSILVFSHGLTV